MYTVLKGGFHMSKSKVVKNVIIAVFSAAAAAVLIFILVTLVFCLSIREKKEGTLLCYTEIGKTTYINFKETSVNLDHHPFIEGNTPKSSESYSLLKSFVNLESLYTCSTIPVNDLSFLKHTRKMKNLYVYIGNYTDLSPLSKLSNLETLTLSVENVNDLSPLYSLESAKKICLLDADNFASGDFEKLSENLPDCQITAYNKIYDMDNTYGYGSGGQYEKTPVYKNY